MTSDALRRRPRRQGGLLPLAPWRLVENGLDPVEVLSADQVEAIHSASLRILATIGLEVLGDAALDRFARASGATVDRATRTVRLDPGLVEELVALAPADFRLHARNPARTIAFGGRHLVFSSVGGPAFVTDLDRGRRAGNHADLLDYLRVVSALDVIHQEGGGPLEPTDLPVETRHLDLHHAQATLLDKTWQCLGTGRVVVEDALRVAEILFGVDRDALAGRPPLMTIINTNSPLRLDGPMSDGLIAMAEAGQAVVATPFTLAGAMTPVTLAAALAQQNAEALFCIALAQLVRAGAPVVYGAFTSNVDMRTGAPAFGTPESAKGALASGQLARRYGLPWRSSNVTASPVVDAQAAYESEMAIWSAVMGGVNLLYQAAGWLEGGLTASFEKLILDAELLAMIRDVLVPIEVSEATLALDTIAEVGAGGHFFGTAHTLERFETAFYRPLVSDWRSVEAWQEDGGRTATERANSIWKRILAAFEPPALDPGVREALDEFVARRKRELGA
ncbi:MAG TPA: trimethylamine methyltransferase family protein [Candidatus Limnocylindrales bacterium]|nr:trimethylamine methyltransferase family protein [Candidatus Limnocylindrales bacterium]